MNLHSLVISRSTTLETSFLKEFAGLEALILNFRRQHSHEFVIQNREEWSSFKGYLKKCIKESTESELNGTQRASIYQKLEELNRISLREAFDLFCSNYSINLSDLWPVFKNNNIVGLAEIRNKLIHGDPLPPDLNRSLIFAKEHLKCILERVVVRVLKWDIENTKISSNSLELRYMGSFSDILPEQQKISDYIMSQNNL